MFFVRRGMRKATTLSGSSKVCLPCQLDWKSRKRSLDWPTLEWTWNVETRLCEILRHFSQWGVHVKCVISLSPKLPRRRLPKVTSRSQSGLPAKCGDNKIDLQTPLLTLVRSISQRFSLGLPRLASNWFTCEVLKTLHNLEWGRLRYCSRNCKYCRLIWFPSAFCLHNRAREINRDVPWLLAFNGTLGSETLGLTA